MLNKQKVLNSLENKKQDFISYTNKSSDELQMLQSKFDSIFQISAIDIINNLKLKTDTPGAMPLDEWDKDDISIKFEETFENHQQSRQWAYNTLLDNITFAVDGSQILVSKDISPPVAAVQVAKFENFHSTDGLYTKDIDFEVITSKELSTDELSGISKDNYVNYKRVELEINTIIEYIKESHNNKLRPIVFLDGSLIFTFITAEGATSGNKLYINYIDKICELLDIAEKYKIAIIGYIDTSNARDIVDMLRTFYCIPENSIIDTQLINKYLQWGDRSLVFKCDRPGVLKQYKKHKDQIGFCYLKTNKNLPSRLEFPLWLYEEKEYFKHVLNIIRAEIIIGNGYIYSIESADATAVINSKDKKVFYQIFSEFAYKNNLNTNLSQKSLSKNKRRS